MDIGHEVGGRSVKGAQKSRLFAVTGVYTKVSKANSAGEGGFNQLQGKTGFAPKATGGLWNRGLVAARRRRYPVFREIQTGVNQARQLASTQGRKHPDLTVVYLAQATIPLPGHPS